MLLAGGQGSRLGVLTADVAKPAVSFGGKYRIIDFPLSNCINSGVDTVGVLTQYQPLELNRYIGNGNPWDLDRSHGGVYVLPPYQSAKAGEWYKGTANAIYQNLSFLESFKPENVLILSGDHIYKMHYGEMLKAHKESGAAVTIAVMPVPWEEASRFGIMNVDEEGTITDFEEKPAEPERGRAHQKGGARHDQSAFFGDAPLFSELSDCVRNRRLPDVSLAALKKEFFGTLFVFLVYND